MLDPTPAPFGDFTRRWTHLPDDERHWHVARVLGAGCTNPDTRHIERPGLDDGDCYRQLIVAVRRGDPIAFGWLATSHRPQLVARGAALLEQDASEWAGVCLEGLQLVIADLDLSIGRWLRRRVSHRLATHVTRATTRQVRRRRREQPIAVTALDEARGGYRIDPTDSLCDLSIDLDRLMAGLDPMIREAFFALANDESIVDIADRHEVSYGALRRRMSRARLELRPELAGYVRTGGS